MMLSENKKEKKNFFSLLLGNLFGNSKKSIFEEEQIQSPTKTIVKNFISNRLSMSALCLFIGILLFVIIAPKFFVLDLGYNDPTQQNIKPIRSLMNLLLKTMLRQKMLLIHFGGVNMKLISMIYVIISDIGETKLDGQLIRLMNILAIHIQPVIGLEKIIIQEAYLNRKTGGN